jgi:hypothetical protein
VICCCNVPHLSKGAQSCPRDELQISKSCLFRLLPATLHRANVPRGAVCGNPDRATLQTVTAGHGSVAPKRPEREDQPDADWPIRSIPSRGEQSLSMASPAKGRPHVPVGAKRRHFERLNTFVYSSGGLRDGCGTFVYVRLVAVVASNNIEWTRIVIKYSLFSLFGWQLYACEAHTLRFTAPIAHATNIPPTNQASIQTRQDSMFETFPPLLCQMNPIMDQARLLSIPRTMRFRSEESEEGICFPVSNCAYATDIIDIHTST